jgi:hypothetical protein
MTQEQFDALQSGDRLVRLSTQRVWLVTNISNHPGIFADGTPFSRYISIKVERNGKPFGASRAVRCEEFILAPVNQ